VGECDHGFPRTYSWSDDGNRLQDKDLQLTSASVPIGSEESEAFGWLGDLPALQRVKAHDNMSWMSGGFDRSDDEGVASDCAKMKRVERFTASLSANFGYGIVPWTSKERDCYVHAWSQVLHLLPSLTHLALTVTSHEWKHNRALMPEVIASIARCTKVTDLTLAGIFADDLHALTAEWSTLDVDLPVERLTIDFAPEGRWTKKPKTPRQYDFGRAVQGIACLPHLRHLSLSVHHLENGGQSYLTQLPQLTQLRSLTIEDTVSERASFTAGIIELWCQPNSFLHLQALSIGTSAQLSPADSGQLWSSLPQLLTLPKLQVLTLQDGTFNCADDRDKRQLLRATVQRANDTRTPAIDLQFKIDGARLWERFSSLHIEGDQE
jgi:hypothetical protein